MVDAVLGAGVDSNLSKIYAATLTGKVSGTTFIEAYGRGPIMTEAKLNRRNLNVRGLHALDLRTTKEDGTPWDFKQRSDRKSHFNLLSAIVQTGLLVHRLARLSVSGIRT